jgi:hypothetical protein
MIDRELGARTFVDETATIIPATSAV